MVQSRLSSMFADGRLSFSDWLLRTSFTLVQSYYHRTPHGSLIPIVIGWTWAGVVLSTAFGAELSAQLAIVDIEQKVDTIPELLSAGFTWGHKVTNRDDPTNTAFFINESVRKILKNPCT